MIGTVLYYHQKHELRIMRRRLRDTTNPFDIPETRFIEIYRFPINLAIDLVDELKPFLVETTRSDGIPIHLKVLSAMEFFASGSYQRRVGQNFLAGISQTCISRFINEVAAAISNNLVEKYIRFPQTPTEEMIVKRGFNEIDSSIEFCGILGCVDGGHIPMVALRANIERHYVNRKQSKSKNVQFICDANLKFIGLFGRYSGATHDSYIWSVSQARLYLENKFNMGERSTFLLGDSGYPLEPWLLTPYRNPSSPTQEWFNKCHCKIRSIVERSIGLFKSRWRCCCKEKPLRYEPEKCGKIINACATLHNILIENKFPISSYEEQLIQEEIELHRRETAQNEEPDEDPPLINRSVLREGENIRNRIAQHLFAAVN